MSRMNDELSPLSSGIDSVTPFPQLEDDVGLATLTPNDDDEALHMKATPRRNRAGTTHSVIRASPSPSVPKSESQSPTELSDDTRNPNAEQILSPSIEIQEDSEDAEFQSQYYVENESLEGAEDLSLGSTGEEFNDDDDELQDLSSDEDGDDDSHERGSHSVNMHRPFMQSTSSLTGPNAFAPPFYNRPPTPLPPSPSLTSLLRPPFSTTTSRPTTPDTSDAETPNDTEAAVAKSARIATTVPRASPKVPTYEYYGFVLYLTSSFAFLMYLLWSYLPSPFLHQLGIYYYPNRWWSLAIPAWLVMFLVYIYVALACYNTGYLTLPMTSIENIVDEAANIAVIDGKGRRRLGGSEKLKPGSATSQTMSTAQNRRVPGLASSNSASGSGYLLWKDVWAESTDAVMDIPVGGVCEVLYGRDREEDPSISVHSEEYESVHDSWRRRFREDLSLFDDSSRYRAAQYSSPITDVGRSW
ncbi:hypothetical protein TMatcc_000047 [Talaromyces marneffei ATCC 18224]|uniref:PIG-P domain-containing protein n=1 Tax=Talaromyces marneffei (strain ATCC 18224 / CBS 334.59 / QM 7333) TaxID=441960 RepID=B6QPV6_TALMQ|nr:uncharacterized protein EYB26_005142 [Talaromyces marneffei]EEA20074.1 conserved hypothetical protein [Talaromyces marneffei ATCC 18224]QGA17471.1 hypothetical protein EYB26_005142 [Talaromyces marneffei]